MHDGEGEHPANLPEPVRDHLGQQLRGILPVETGKPQFLGDDPISDAFAPQIRKLETRLKTHEEGTEAVENALGRILDAFGIDPAGNKPGA